VSQDFTLLLKPKRPELSDGWDDLRQKNDKVENDLRTSLSQRIWEGKMDRIEVRMRDGT
jgi:hypothetical protein